MKRISLAEKRQANTKKGLGVRLECPSGQPKETLKDIPLVPFIGRRSMHHLTH